MQNWAKLILFGVIGSFSCFTIEASAQQYAGPLLPHVGGQVTTAFANRYGPDAEGYITFSAVTPEQLSLDYSSTRGLNVRRHILMADRRNAETESKRNCQFSNGSWTRGDSANYDSSTSDEDQGKSADELGDTFFMTSPVTAHPSQRVLSLYTIQIRDGSHRLC